MKIKIKKPSTAKLKLKVKKNGPTACIIFGILGMTAAGIDACFRTLEAKDILDKGKEELKAIEEDDMTISNLKKARRVIKAKTVGKVAKTYARPVAIATISAGSILYGYDVINKRNAELGAAFTALNQSYKEYRKKVVDTFGAEAEEKMRFDISEETTEKEVEGKNGKKKVVKETKRVVNNPNGCSMYAKVFDSASPYWENDPDSIRWFLTVKQNHFNDRLKIDGYVFLNDVYKALGIPPTRAGQHVGWIYDPENPLIDNYIDFGIYDNLWSSVNRDFLNGHETFVILDFNVDGEIIDLFEKIQEEK